MDWEIFPFEGMGSVKFGMSPDQVAFVMGPPESTDEDEEYLKEFRAVDQPIVSYENGAVTEIEAFYDVENVHLKDLYFFQSNGLEAMRRLEAENGGALINVGVVIFADIGISVGRLDEGVREDHSVTAFSKGLWDDRLARFKPISFVG